MDLSASQKIFLTEILDDWQREAKRLTRSSQISSDDIVAIVNVVEAMLLNWKQTLYAFFNKVLAGFGCDLWIIAE